MLKYFTLLLFARGHFKSNSLSVVYKNAKTRGRLLHYALPNKPKREDDVVYVSEEEVREVASDFGRMDKASAQYILKYMPTHTFGRIGKMRMKKLYIEAKEELERDAKEGRDEEQEQRDEACGGESIAD